MFLQIFSKLNIHFDIFRPLQTTFDIIDSTQQFERIPTLTRPSIHYRRRRAGSAATVKKERGAAAPEGDGPVVFGAAGAAAAA